ncbi:YhcN/YlaJ family sporulation lipoprotein [Peribacillus sp. SCS-155]|uniref:YhcN/YlaJ family sporulation lipoprotein n=1 Tax=Peribacillus sedimenti TaxID=3115297 RepID=UPI003905A269
MMNKLILTFASAVLLTGLAGCGDNRNDAADDGNDNVQIRGTDPNNNNNNNGNDRNIRISNRAEDKLEKMKGVDQAHVIVSNNNAYVALRMDNDNRNNGTEDGNRRDNDAAGSRVNDGVNGYGAGYGFGNGTNASDVDRGGMRTDLGDRGQDRTNGNDNNRGDNAGTFDIIPDNNNNGNDGLTDLNGNNNDRNNNNGTDKNNYSRVNTRFKQQVADRCRAADKNIHKVYVSTDGDFYNRMAGYSDDIVDGQNGGELINDFNNTIRDMFNVNR